VSLRAWLGRLIRRRRRPVQHDALKGSRWSGVYASTPHRELDAAEERARRAAANAANQPRPWLAPRDRERW